jgi:non-ribosomal peptide synthetase component F
MGFFINTLALHTHLPADPSFRELLARVRDVTLKAYAHQDLPFEKLMEDLQPARDLSCHLLFQVLFARQNTPPGSVQMGELRVQNMDIAYHPGQFGLVLSLWEGPQGLMGGILSDQNPFTAETIRCSVRSDPGQMAHALQRLQYNLALAFDLKLLPQERGRNRTMPFMAVFCAHLRHTGPTSPTGSTPARSD